ncbi:MAG: insulinase family protein [Clostridiales bacterium]|nr:insulinase family protein [Clostridiales bacterium]
MFEERKLKNGIRVVTDDMPYMNSISLGVYVGIGSRYEDEKTNGAAHFIEHMLFKGTEKRTAADIAGETDEIGGQINAYTTKEYTCFYFRALSEHLEKALEILADMILNSKFDDDAIKRERTVIDEEISIYEDNPEDVVFDKLQYEIWGRKNLGLEILGTHDTISAFDSSFLRSYFKRNYRPDNIVISAAGKFDRETLYSQLESAFSPLKPKNTEVSFEKAVYTPKIVKTKRDVEQLHLCLAFPSPKFGEKSSALSVLNAAVGGGMSSRLFRKIREEKGLCYSVYSASSSFTDTGIFMVYCGLSPSNCEKVLSLCRTELQNMKEEKISESELLKIKGQIKSNFLLSDESTSSRSSRMGRNVLLRGFCPSNEKTLSDLEKTNSAEILTICREIFDFDKMSISLAGKTEGISI